MTFDEAMAYAKQFYRKFFVSRITLSFTNRNLMRALYVYHYGVENERTLRRTVIGVYGYRYRRMENFLRELYFYEPGKWMGVRALCKPKRPKHTIAEYEYEFVTPEDAERLITELFITRREDGYRKPRIKEERERVRTRETIMYLDLEIEACKPICEYDFNTVFLAEIVELIQEKLYPVGMALAEKVWEVLREGFYRCDYRLEPCPLAIREGKVYTHVKARAGLIKCIRHQPYQPCYYYLGDYGYLLLDEERPLWQVFSK